MRKQILFLFFAVFALTATAWADPYNKPGKSELRTDVFHATLFTAGTATVDAFHSTVHTAESSTVNTSDAGGVYYGQNSETLTGNKTLTADDVSEQHLDPGGTGRDVTMPAEADTIRRLFWITNNADGSGENLVIKSDAPATLGTLAPGMVGRLVCDGTDWIMSTFLPADGIYVDGVSGNIGINTTTPTSQLHIVNTYDATIGNGAFVSLYGVAYKSRLYSSAQNGVLDLRNSSNTHTVSVNSGASSYFNGGNVGMGTTTPLARADIKASTADGSTDGLVVRDSDDAEVFAVDSDGNVASEGSVNSVNYRTIQIDAAAMVPCTTSGAAAGTYEYGTNDIEWDYLAFDGGATEERSQYKLVMPEDWDRSTVKVKFYWANATGASAADTVEWGVKAAAVSDDDAIDTALGIAVTVSDTLTAPGDLHITSATGALTVGGSPAIGDLITFEFYRNTDGTDDMSEDAWLVYVVIQYATSNTVVSAW